MGQHIWYLRRGATTQYPMRNMYDGEFVYGQRHGFGTFYYANGARYEGHWQQNLKCGKVPPSLITLELEIKCHCECLHSLMAGTSLLSACALLMDALCCHTFSHTVLFSEVLCVVV